MSVLIPVGKGSEYMKSLLKKWRGWIKKHAVLDIKMEDVSEYFYVQPEAFVALVRVERSNSDTTGIEIFYLYEDGEPSHCIHTPDDFDIFYELLGIEGGGDERNKTKRD